MRILPESGAFVSRQLSLWLARENGVAVFRRGINKPYPSVHYKERTRLMSAEMSGRNESIFFIEKLWKEKNYN